MSTSALRSFRAVAVLGAVLLGLAGSASAQTPRSPLSGRFAGPVLPLPGYVEDGPHYYSYSPGTAYSPILMTSINYPGVYGSYVSSPAAMRYLNFTVRSPFFYHSPVASGQSSLYVAPAVSTVPAPVVASVAVRLPAEAELWIEGAETSQTGSFRQFVSPPLVPGRSYTYEITACWRKEGRPVTETRTLPVRAGDQLEVDFTSPSVEDSSTLRTLPRR